MIMWQTRLIIGVRRADHNLWPPVTQLLRQQLKIERPCGLMLSACRNVFFAEQVTSFMQQAYECSTILYKRSAFVGEGRRSSGPIIAQVAVMDKSDVLEGWGNTTLSAACSPYTPSVGFSVFQPTSKWLGLVFSRRRR